MVKPTYFQVDGFDEDRFRPYQMFFDTLAEMCAWLTTMNDFAVEIQIVREATMQEIKEFNA